MDDGIGPSRVKKLLARVFPVGIPDFKLYFRDGYNLFQGKTAGVPEVDGQIVGGSGDEILVL